MGFHTTETCSSLPIIYAIDHRDVLVDVNEAFVEFACANEARAVARSEVIGTSLWGHITDAPTRLIYRTLIERVRTENVTVGIPFRCDSPSLRRFMTLKLAPSTHDGVVFTSITERVEPRDEVVLLRTDVERSAAMVRMCSMCKRVDAGERGWHEVEEALMLLGLGSVEAWPQITHGLCDPCYEMAMARI